MRLIKTLLTLIILLGVVLSLSPLALKWHIQKTLQDAGLNAEIKKVSLDYIFGQASMAGVAISNERGEQITLLTAEADLNLPALFQRQLQMSAINVQDLHADLNLVNEVRALLLPRKLDKALFAGDSVWVHKVRHAQFTNLEICRATQQQCLYVEKAALGRATWETEKGHWVLRHSLPMTINKGFLRDQTSGNAIFFLGDMNIAEGFVSRNRLDLKNAVFNNLHMVESAFMGEQLDTPFQTQIGTLTISQIEYTAGDKPALTLGDVAGESVRQSIHRNAEGRFALPQRMRQWFPEIEGLTERWRRDMAFSLASLRLNGGALAWYDKSVTPAAVANFSHIHLELGKFDTTAPTVATPVNLKAKHGDKGSVVVDGAVFFNASPRTYNVNVNLQDINLAGISAYSDARVGARVQEAIVDTATVLSAENGQLKVESRWQIAGLKMDTTRDKGRSIQASFDVASDHNQSIRMNLAYNGRLDAGTTTFKHFFGTLMPAQLRQLESPSPAAPAPNP